MWMKGNGGAGGALTKLDWSRLEVNGDVWCAGLVCGDCVGGGDVGCGLCCGGYDGWLQEKQVVKGQCPKGLMERLEVVRAIVCETAELVLRALLVGEVVVVVVVGLVLVVS